MGCSPHEPLEQRTHHQITKVKPLVFTPDTQAYYGIGKFVGQAFSVGKGI
jgi:hypothetical protein